MQKNSVTLQMFDVKTYQKTLTSFVGDSHAKLSVLLEKGRDSMTQEEHYFLKSHGFYDISKELGNQSHTLYSKMLKVYLTTKMDEHLLLYTEFLPTLIIPLNAKWLILSGFSPKTESGYLSLADILETQVEEKYFLSENQVKSLTRGIQKSQIVCNTQDTQVKTTEE